MKTIKQQYQELISNSIKLIQEKTESKAFEFFTEDNVYDLFESGELYELPYGYFIDKYGYYVQGQIMTVKGNDVVLYLTGESDHGNLWNTSLQELPGESIIELTEYIK